MANVPWPGNPTPRIAETACGMLNAIGLQNPGIDVFAKRDIPFLKQYDTKIIVNVCGKSTEDYLELIKPYVEKLFVVCKDDVNIIVSEELGDGRKISSATDDELIKLDNIYNRLVTKATLLGIEV